MSCDALEDYISSHYEELEQEFKINWGSSGYEITPTFMDDYEEEFNDFVFAKWEEYEQGRGDYLMEMRKDELLDYPEEE